MTSDLTPASGQGRDQDQVPVFIVRTGPRDAVVVREGEGGGSWVDIALEFASPLVEQLPWLKVGGKASARTFTLDPNSLKNWDSLNKHGADGYSYGVFWRGDGKIDSLIKLKESFAPMGMSAPAAFNPMTAALLVLVVSLKSDIERLEGAIAEVGADVKNIVRFLEVEQESDVLAAFDTIHRIHAVLHRDGVVSQEDWDRVSGLEQILKKVERQVLSQMSTIADTMDFDAVQGAKRATKAVTAERLEQLKFLLQYDLWALEEWVEIMLARKAGNGSLRLLEVEDARNAVESTRSRAVEMLRNIENHSGPDAVIRGTGPLKLLFTKGLGLGWYDEGKIIGKGMDLRAQMLKVAVERSALEPAPLATITVDTDGEG